MALTVPLAVTGVLWTAADPANESLILAFFLVGTPVLPSCWAILRVLGPKRPAGPVMSSLIRVIGVAPIAAWPPAIAAAVTVSLPSVQAQILETRRPDGWRYFFGDGDGSLLVQALWLHGIAGLFLGMLSALVVWVVIVFPVLAWSTPLQAAAENMLNTESQQGRAAAARTMRAYSVMVFLIFAIPACIVFGSREADASGVGEAFANIPAFFTAPEYYWGDVVWALGIVLIPAGVLMVVLVKVWQRPNKQLRARYNLNALSDKLPGEGVLPTGLRREVDE